MTTHSKQLAQFVEQVRFKDLPVKVVQSTACSLIDHIAVGMYGSSQPWSRIVADHAKSEDGGQDGKCVIYGQAAKTNALRAARINGTASHGFELDDIYEPGLCHPGAVVIASALALGTELGMDGTRLIEAIVCGYEVMGRVAASTVHVYGTRGLHSTGTAGPFGSAAAAGKMMGFTEAEFLNSWGLSASFAGGVKAFQGGGGMVKRLHAGRAAENGIFAAQLTKRGFEGPPHGLDGRLGYLEVHFNGQGRPEILSQSLGSSYAIENMYLKPFACCGMIHSTIQTAMNLKHAHDFSPAKIDQIIIGASKKGILENSVPDPTDTMGAQYSLECGAVLGALGIATDPKSYAVESVARPEVQSLLKKTKVVVDDEVEAVFPEHLACRVTIRFQDGREVTAFERDMPRYESLASRRKATEEKFRVLTSGYWSTSQQDRVLREIDRLAEGGSAEAVAASLCQA